MQTFKAQIEIPASRISNLLCSAFEGGSNYWYFIKKFVEPTSYPNKDPEDGETIYKHLDYPLNPGGALIITAESDYGDEEINGQTEFILNLEAIKKGIELMSKEQPRHFADFINEDDDATTGDVFLQLCLFGEVVFG